MIRVKEGVVFRAIREEIWRLFPILEQLFKEIGKDCWITSAGEGVHGEGSKHYVDQALDLRIWHLTLKERQKVMNRLAPLTGYDTVLEKDHIHVEWDPKKGEVWR